MDIKTLLKRVNNNKIIVFNHKINKLSDDSRNIDCNDVFFAIKGVNYNGLDFIDDAIKNGAKTIIYEEEFTKEFHNINYVKVDDVKRFLALCCKFFYKDITKKVKMIGVTGTNGKTTISTVLMDFLSYSGEDSLLIGSNGIFYKDEHFHIDNTTPGILKIYDTIKSCLKKGLKYVVMEVSSIAIREARVSYFDFDILIFTNLTHDHLDYHKNITDYKYSKAALLWKMKLDKNKVVILNTDDENYRFYLSLTSSNVITYGIKNEALFVAENIVKSLHESQFIVKVKNNKYIVKSSLIGGFNIYNILAVISAISFLNLSISSFVDFLRIYIPVSGRMNQIKYKNRLIIIDFAHTPDGVLKVLTNIKELSSYKLSVVIGCGGSRDTLKRKTIGDIALKYADRVIFTADNPRDENPLNIINDMIKDTIENNYEIILDRKKAINHTLDTSNPYEVIAILGKGNERSQIINGIMHPFSDKETVYNWIKREKHHDN